MYPNRRQVYSGSGRLEHTLNGRSEMAFMVPDNRIHLDASQLLQISYFPIRCGRICCYIFRSAYEEL